LRAAKTILNVITLKAFLTGGLAVNLRGNNHQLTVWVKHFGLPPKRKCVGIFIEKCGMQQFGALAGMSPQLSQYIFFIYLLKFKTRSGYPVIAIGYHVLEQRMLQIITRNDAHSINV